MVISYLVHAFKFKATQNLETSSSAQVPICNFLRTSQFSENMPNFFDTETSFHGKNLCWESKKNLEGKKLFVFLPEEYEVDRCVEKKVIH